MSPRRKKVWWKHIVESKIFYGFSYFTQDTFDPCCHYMFWFDNLGFIFKQENQKVYSHWWLSSGFIFIMVKSVVEFQVWGYKIFKYFSKWNNAEPTKIGPTLINFSIITYLKNHISMKCSVKVLVPLYFKSRRYCISKDTQFSLEPFHF